MPIRMTLIVVIHMTWQTHVFPAVCTLSVPSNAWSRSASGQYHVPSAVYRMDAAWVLLKASRCRLTVTCLLAIKVYSTWVSFGTADQILIATFAIHLYILTLQASQRFGVS